MPKPDSWRKQSLRCDRISSMGFGIGRALRPWPPHLAEDSRDQQWSRPMGWFQGWKRAAAFECWRDELTAHVVTRVSGSEWWNRQQKFCAGFFWPIASGDARWCCENRKLAIAARSVRCRWFLGSAAPQLSGAVYTSISDDTLVNMKLYVPDVWGDQPNLLLAPHRLHCLPF